MDASEVLGRLTALGVTATPTPRGTLWLQPASVIPPDLVDAVREHKQAIIAAIRERAPIAAETTYLQRLRAGQVWLAVAHEKLAEMEERRDIVSQQYEKQRERFLVALDAWDVMERQLRQLLGYQGCIHGPGRRCPPDSVVVCQACERRVSDGTNGTE
jgi:hypothetical protein